MKKVFVLSTEATLSSENALFAFGGDNDVVIPMSVLENLYNYKGSPEKKKVASKIINYINGFEPKDIISKEGVRQSNGSRLRVVDSERMVNNEKLSSVSALSDLYKRAFSVCLELKMESSSRVIFISQNPTIRMKAASLGIESQLFKDEIFPDVEDQYKGVHEVYVLKNVADSFYKNGSIPIKEIAKGNEFKWYENMFVKLIIADNMNKTVLGRYTDGKIVQLQYQNKSYIPLNMEQKMLMECLLAPPEIAPLVIVKGGAGTGKTFCALSAALENVAKYGKNSLYEQILVATPTVTIGEDLGYLPGDIDDKVGPYIGGIKDNLSAIFKAGNPEASLLEIADEIQEIFYRKYVQVQPIGFLRGRSIPNTFFLLDETQNVKPEIIKDILTRMAKGSKIVLAGDHTQVNEIGLNERRNGLVYASEKFKGSSLCWQITLNNSKIIRSDLSDVAQKIL